MLFVKWVLNLVLQNDLYACVLYINEKSYSVTKISYIKYKNDKPYVCDRNKKYFVKLLKTGIYDKTNLY